MSTVSSIEWTDRTWNPLVGCRRVSPGCQHCYAEVMAARIANAAQAALREGKTLTEIQTAYRQVVMWERGGIDAADQHDKALPKWNGRVVPLESVLSEPLTWRKPQRIFVNSMSDLFHESTPHQFIDRVFAVMAIASQHTFQILTKRADRLREYVSAADRPDHVANFCGWEHGRADVGRALIGQDGNGCRVAPSWPLPNVWLGVSAEDQQRADERIPHLLETPAAVRFISAEPLLGQIDLRRYIGNTHTIHVSADVEGMIANKAFDYIADDDGTRMSPESAEQALRDLIARGVKRIRTTDECVGFSDQTGCPGHKSTRAAWVIVGGESGHGARPCNLAWLDSLINQCKKAGTPVFVKQLGANVIDPGDSLSVWPDWPDWPDITVLKENPHRGNTVRVHLKSKKGGDPLEWPATFQVRQFPNTRPSA